VNASALKKHKKRQQRRHRRQNIVAVIGEEGRGTLEKLIKEAAKKIVDFEVLEPDDGGKDG
jgi:predicted nucleotide-binding protein